MNSYLTILAIPVLLILLSCHKDTGIDPGPAPGIQAVSGLRAVDVSNRGNAADIEFYFSKPVDLSNIEAFRAFLIPKADAASATATAAASLETTRYTQITPGQSAPYTFPEDLPDLFGQAVEEGKDYALFVLSLSSDSRFVHQLSKAVEVRLEQKTAVRTLAVLPTSGTGGMDVDAQGNVYMGDFGDDTNGGGNMVSKISPDGRVTTFASGFQTATGNDFDRQGNLFQSSFSNNTIYKITPDGIKSVFAAGPPLNGPVGLAFDAGGSLFVANYNANAILKITPNGTMSPFSAAASLNGPNGLDFDSNGTLYVSNWLDGRITRIRPNGETAVLTTVPSGQNAHLLIRNDVIYFVARSVHSIYKVSLSGTVTRFIGAGVRGGANGPAAEATLSYPNDIALSPDGTIMYINHNSPAAAGTTVLSPAVVREVSIVE